MKLTFAFICPFLISALLGAQPAKVMNPSIIHIAELEIDPVQMDRFKAAAIDNINATLSKEQGALEFYAVFKSGTPGEVLVWEIYADARAYAAHLRSAHYEKFGSIAEALVKKKTLYAVTPIVLARKHQLPSTAVHVRIAQIEVIPAQLDAYKTDVREEIEASIRVEPGVLAIYCVALNDSPNQLRFLEVYANEDAYLRHRESPHFKKYLTATRSKIRSLALFEAEPILLGTKPTPDDLR